MFKLAHKLVLGTAQFGMDYGIANLAGKPSKKDVFKIFDFAWEKGVRKFDTAPGYGSEILLGEFIKANGLQDHIKVLTKIPSMENSNDYKVDISASIQTSIKALGSSMDVLFFHNPKDSSLLSKNPNYFKNLLKEYSISSIGVSVYDPDEVEAHVDSQFELCFQFPFNVLDRRFAHVDLPKGKRYARSIFLQGLLASKKRLRQGTSKELLKLQRDYHQILIDNNLDPISISISFVSQNNSVDYFLVGVDTIKQLSNILKKELYHNKIIDAIKSVGFECDDKWLDPRKWN
jgi:aryl-alcohol dehydrogenase-like predicted oxidoreductase